jgi:hypothetical protein
MGLPPDVDVGPEGGVAGVVDPAVGGLDVHRGHHGLHRGHRGKEAQAAHRLDPHPWVRITSLLAKHLLGRRDPLPLVGEHAGGRSAGVGRRGFEQFREQRRINSMKTLLQPEHFHP